VATGRHSRPSSPSLAISAPSSSPPPLPPHSPFAATFPLIRQQQSNSSQQSPTSSSPIGDPSARILTSTGLSGVSRSSSTALRDDLPDSPRPRKRPRLQSSSDLDSPMKFENSTSTDVGEISDVHESNGTSSTNIKNGIVKETTNGVSPTFTGNGTVQNGSRVNDNFFGHSREEVTRLMIQTLNDLGYRYHQFRTSLFEHKLINKIAMLQRSCPMSLALIPNPVTYPSFETPFYREIGLRRSRICQISPFTKMLPWNKPYS
jgi:hypothetical protein